MCVKNSILYKYLNSTQYKFEHCCQRFYNECVKPQAVNVPTNTYNSYVVIFLHVARLLSDNKMAMVQFFIVQ